MHAPLTSHSPTRRPGRFHRVLLGTTVALPVLLSGCTAATAPQSGSDSTREAPAAESEASTDSAAASDRGSAGTATFTVGDRTFDVELTFCGIYDDGAEIVLSGPALEGASGARGFLDGGVVPYESALNGEFRIDIGADGPSQSTDEFVALGSVSGIPITLSKDDGGYTVHSGAWNENGDDLGEGILAFSCS